MAPSVSGLTLGGWSLKLGASVIKHGHSFLCNCSLSILMMRMRILKYAHAHETAIMETSLKRKMNDDDESLSKHWISEDKVGVQGRPLHAYKTNPYLHPWYYFQHFLWTPKNNITSHWTFLCTISAATCWTSFRFLLVRRLKYEHWSLHTKGSQVEKTQ